MSKGFLDWFSGNKRNTSAPKQKSSAEVATDRLKVIVASERKLSNRLSAEKIELMKREIIDIVNNHVRGGVVSINDVTINHRVENNLDMLEMNINLPERAT